jgi:hypothetical protein
MSSQITKTVYSFSELLKVGDSVAVERARCRLQEIALNDDWYEYELSVWKSALEQVGFIRPDINFSGFSSQGDGASFVSECDTERLFWYSTHKIVGKNCIKPTKRTGTDEDFLPWLVYQIGGQYGYCSGIKRLGSKIVEGLSFSVDRLDNHYSHERTCRLVVRESTLSDTDYARVKDWVSDLENLRIRICQAIYSGLEHEHDYCITDESLISIDSIHEFCWDINGRME